MRLCAIPATAFVAFTLLSLQLSAADFGGLLGQFPFLSGSGESTGLSSDSADSDGAVQVSVSTQPDAAQPAPLEPPDLGDAAPIEGAVSSPESVRGARPRSPIPPPHIPDESTGMRCESVLEGSGREPMAMIESDAARAAAISISPPPPPSVDAAPPSVDAVPQTVASVPQTVDFDQLLAEPCVVPGYAGVDEAAGPLQHRQPHHGGAYCTQPQPTPYIYTGPGLPPPASLESYTRTPECYRGLWDGFAEEKYRRCECCHRHLHGQCDCHRLDCRPDPSAARCGVSHTMLPAGMCAQRQPANSPTVPAVTR